MRILIDTHFLIWITTESSRLEEFPWLERYSPYGISPVSFLELQFLSEIGKLALKSPDFMTAVMEDPRFLTDEVSLTSLIRHALPLSWTKDPFDRLLCAHSQARKVPLCTVDRLIRQHHALLLPELSSK